MGNNWAGRPKQEEACLNSYLLSDPDRAEDRGPV